MNYFLFLVTNNLLIILNNRNRGRDCLGNVTEYQRTHKEHTLRRKCTCVNARVSLQHFLGVSVLDLLIQLGCAVFGHQISQIHLVYAHAYLSARA